MLFNVSLTGHYKRQGAMTNTTMNKNIQVLSYENDTVISSRRNGGQLLRSKQKNTNCGLHINEQKTKLTVVVRRKKDHVFGNTKYHSQ